MVKKGIQFLTKCLQWGALSMVLAVLISSCATPSSPTGGPPDEEGPEIIKTEPETGTTNFKERRIVLHFSEWIERSSLAQAIIIEPGIGIDYELDWGRKSVGIVFSRAIPDSTTLIVTVGTELTDTQGNEMASPQKVAVSTGDEIDKGKLYGKVINASTGVGDEGHRILLYREPIDLTKPANYIASTDTSGSFQFSYLSDGRYKAFWVDDRNRNKIWDAPQERAQPFDQEFVSLKEAGEDTLGTVYVTSVDSIAPVLQGIGLFSSRRLRLRFSENIVLTDSARIAVTDTLGEAVTRAKPLYIPPDEPYVLFAQSQEKLSESRSYALDIRGITDTYGNSLVDTMQVFTGSAQEDTTQQRIVKRNNLSGYYPTEPIRVTYAAPIKQPVIRDSLKIVAGTELYTDWPHVSVASNILEIRPDTAWKEGIQYEMRVWDPIISDYRKMQPQIWHNSQMGKLNVMTEDSTRKNVVLRITNKEVEINRDTTFTGEVTLGSLPPLTYKVIAFEDKNDNGKWDFGQVVPYKKPEPYFIQPKVPVEKQLTGDLTIAFQ